MLLRFKWKGQPLKLYKDRDGKPYRYSSALAALVKINEQIANRGFDPGEWEDRAFNEKLFNHEMEKWLERKEKEEQDGKLAPSTLGNYKTYAKKYFYSSKQFKDVDVRDIRLKHLQLFYDELSDKGLSSKYRKNVMDGLRTFFRWLHRWGEIEQVPTWPEKNNRFLRNGSL
jgi:hypothetical protein